MKQLLLIIIFLISSCSKFDPKYKVSDCFNSGKWHTVNSTDIPQIMDNTVLQIVKVNESSYSLVVYSKTYNKYHRGSFALRESFLESNGKIDCPKEIKDLSLFHLQFPLIDLNDK